MSFWASFTASVRNFGNRVARIFTRKKNRRLESTQPLNERNHKDLKKETPNNVTVNDSKYVINALNDTPVTDKQFQRCTNFSVKAKNPFLPQINEQTALESYNLETDNHLDKKTIQMEGKSKDVNQLYKEMEEAVAQKVRETMELADARRQALAQGTITRKEIALYVENLKNRPPQVAKTTQKSINALNGDVIVNEEYIIKNSNENKEIPQEQDIVVKDQLPAEEQVKRNDKIEGTVDTRAEVVAASKTENLQIGFEPLETVNKGEEGIVDFAPSGTKMNMAIGALNLAQNAARNYPPYENVSIEQIKSTPSFDEQKIGFESFEETPVNPSVEQPKMPLENKQLELTQGALHLAQKSVRNLSQENSYDAGSNLNPGRNNNNNPFETDSNEELRRFGEDALLLAENAIKNFSTNPFEASEDEAERKILSESASGIRQNDVRCTTNPFDTFEDQNEIRQFGQSYANNPFESVDEDYQEELKHIRTDALTIAQTGAMKIEAVNRQLSEHPEDVDNAFNSLLDSEERQEPLIQIGFESIEEQI